MQKVGFFDSGVGGLTVLESTRETIDQLSFHYLGDTAHCPYGDRPLEDVRSFALRSVQYLEGVGCQHVVMACNISSSIALEPARERHPDLEIHGLINEDLVQEVARTTSTGTVGVMATTGTVKSDFYARQLEPRGLDVLQQPCSPLVPMIEAGHARGSLVNQTLEPLLEPFRDSPVDTLVLGCTHYPFLQSAIQELVGETVQIVDPGRVMARRLARRLPDSNGAEPERSYAATGDIDSLEETLTDRFNRPAPDVQQVTTEPIQTS